MIKRLLGWILALVVAAIIFCVAIILIPMQTKTVETVELTYIFVDVDKDGNKIEYDLFSESHGAADDWSFLFDDGEDNDIQTNTGHLPNKDYIGDPVENEDIKLNDENLEELLEDEIDEIIEKEVNFKTGEDIGIEENIETIIYKSCITPWNNTMNHGESVLAYEQRDDVPTICNVQRRTCDDGILKGSYEQASCREDIKYEYTKVRVISFNNTEPGDLIQNPGYPKNDSAQFDTDGKINQVDDPANTSWNNTNNSPVSDSNSADLTHKDYYNCMSPWGEVVGHGQFIKSYESPLGFVDDKCKVELRLCLDGNLKGKYSYKTCEHKDVTYQDYRAGNEDITKPTPDLMVETLIENDGGLFNWLGGLFR